MTYVVFIIKVITIILSGGDLDGFCISHIMWDYCNDNECI